MLQQGSYPPYLFILKVWVKPCTVHFSIGVLGSRRNRCIRDIMHRRLKCEVLTLITSSRASHEMPFLTLALQAIQELRPKEKLKGRRSLQYYGSVEDSRPSYSVMS